MCVCVSVCVSMCVSVSVCVCVCVCVCVSVYSRVFPRFYSTEILVMIEVLHCTCVKGLKNRVYREIINTLA